MPDNQRINIIIGQRGEANLRKLARALIVLAEHQLDADQDEPTPPKRRSA